ncbi:MAG: LysM peptidoglycan-binding domain-containing protein, partial [Terracidiphilus sp.]
PSVLRMATPPDAACDLHLPAGTATLFAQRIEAIPAARRNAWRYHRVAAEDTLASVAREYSVPQAALAAANQLRSSDSLQGVEALAIPLAPVAAPPARMALYTVRRGDTLVTIADRFGVSLNQLRRWNNIAGIKVEPGRRLHVAEPVSATHSAHSHRGGASAATGAKPHPAAAAKGPAAKAGGPASAKKSGVSAAKKAPAHKAGTSAGTASAKNSSAQ